MTQPDYTRLGRSSTNRESLYTPSESTSSSNITVRGSAALAVDLPIRAYMYSMSFTDPVPPQYLEKPRSTSFLDRKPASMKGVIVEAVEAEYKVVEGLEKPKPDLDQILVKSITTAANPVDTFMQSSGMLVTSWPVVLGCDASGVIVEVGKGSAASSFKVGQHVAGCTRLGVPGHSTFEEYFCMDARLTLPVPKDLSFQQAATLGVGTYTACLGLFQGLKLGAPTLPLPPPKEEWVVILGGAGSVGQYSVQIAKALGYQVIATCSKRTAGLVVDFGANATIDYSRSESEQLQELKSITGGNFSGVWDAVARNEQLARRMLDEVSTTKQKCFATVDDWTPMEEHKGHETYRTALGPIGRAEGQADADKTLDDAIASYIPFLKYLLETGRLRPNGFKVVSTGFEGVAQAVESQQKGTGGGLKVLVDLQDAE